MKIWIDLTTRSLTWDHEGMNKDVSHRNCILEGESDEEVLKELKDNDPCGDYDDDVFFSRISNFLKSHENQSATNYNSSLLTNETGEVDNGS